MGAESRVDDVSAAIRARRLRRSFGRFVAVDDVDIDLAPGEVFGLLGANGAGKTTTIRMLCGMLPPDAGTVDVGGIDMVRHARRARGRIGYVAQRWALYDDLDVIENLDLQAGLYGLSGQRARDRRQWALDYLGLAGVARRMAGALPLGFQRRLALGAALLHEPAVLFLDEPTSGMDPLARQQFWELIYALAESGIGILVTTHYMDEAMFCDRLALMHAGRVVAEGEPDALQQSRLDMAIVELRAADCAPFRAAVRQIIEVRDVLPGAGRLRLRLQPGCDPERALAALRERLERSGVAVEGLAIVPPTLEDVFVAMLERDAR